MNSIIENILQLSQRRRSTLERLPLQAMVEQFLDDFLLDKNPAPEIERIIEPPNTQILFDRSQLMQVLANLVGNALRHTIKHPGKPHITLHGGVSRQSSNPFLDVIDYGEGIAPDVAEQIFEPFFTTAAKGSGLGLYLSRELCEANRARLNYLPIPTGGSCFRISFSSVPNNPVN